MNVGCRQSPALLQGLDHELAAFATARRSSFGLPRGRPPLPATRLAPDRSAPASRPGRRLSSSTDLRRLSPCGCRHQRRTWITIGERVTFAPRSAIGRRGRRTRRRPGRPPSTCGTVGTHERFGASSSRLRSRWPPLRPRPGAMAPGSRGGLGRTVNREVAGLLGLDVKVLRAGHAQASAATTAAHRPSIGERQRRRDPGRRAGGQGRDRHRESVAGGVAALVGDPRRADRDGRRRSRARPPRSSAMDAPRNGRLRPCRSAPGSGVLRTISSNPAADLVLTAIDVACDLACQGRCAFRPRARSHGEAGPHSSARG